MRTHESNTTFRAVLVSDSKIDVMDIDPIGALCRRHRPKVSPLSVKSAFGLPMTSVKSSKPLLGQLGWIRIWQGFRGVTERLYRSSTTTLSPSRYTFSSRQFVPCVEAKVPIKSLSKASACLAYELLHAG